MQQRTGNGVDINSEDVIGTCCTHILQTGERFVILTRLCRELEKGLVNNHEICDTSYWTRYGTDDFLGSEWTRGSVLSVVLTVQIFRLKHIRLEPDG